MKEEGGTYSENEEELNKNCSKWEDASNQRPEGKWALNRMFSGVAVGTKQNVLCCSSGH